MARGRISIRLGFGGELLVTQAAKTTDLPVSTWARAVLVRAAKRRLERIGGKLTPTDGSAPTIEAKRSTC